MATVPRILCVNLLTGSALQDANGVEVNDKTIQQMIDGVSILLPKCADIWNVECPKILLVPKGTKANPGDWVFSFINTDPNTPDAEAYHTENSAGAILGYILVETILSAGGFVLNDSSLCTEIPSGKTEVNVHGSQASTVAAAFCHEVFEALIDPHCISWWVSPKPLTIHHSGASDTHSGITFKGGNTMVCGEVCDPVQQNFVCLKIADGTIVALSDFVSPSWSDPYGKKPFNYTQSLTTGYTVDIGGYSVICKSGGAEAQVFSKDMPPAVKVMKENSRRHQKRRKLDHEEK